MALIGLQTCSDLKHQFIRVSRPEHHACRADDAIVRIFQVQVDELLEAGRVVIDPKPHRLLSSTSAKTGGACIHYIMADERSRSPQISVSNSESWAMT